MTGNLGNFSLENLAMSTGTPNLFIVIKLLYKNKTYASETYIKNGMRFKFLIIKRFSGGVVGKASASTTLNLGSLLRKLFFKADFINGKCYTFQ